jgi:hypothetical protein
MFRGTKRPSEYNKKNKQGGQGHQSSGYKSLVQQVKNNKKEYCILCVDSPPPVMVKRIIPQINGPC